MQIISATRHTQSVPKKKEKMRVVFFLNVFIDFRETGREREKEISIGCLPYIPWPGIEPTT